jgi:hypothetical protein
VRETISTLASETPAARTLKTNVAAVEEATEERAGIEERSRALLPSHAVSDAPRADLWHSWLPLALPAGGHRVRTHDRALRTTLAGAGAELVEDGADVAIGSPDAPWIVLPVESQLPQRRFVPLRAAERLVRGIAVRARVARTRRRVAASRVIWWEPNLPVAFDRPRGRGRARLPLRALVVRGEGETILDAVLRETGQPWPERLWAKGGLTLAFGTHGVLRIAVGPARRKLESESRALATLSGLKPPAEVARLVPWHLQQGRTGLADWVLETRWPGTTPWRVGEELHDACVDFLVLLFRTGRGGPVTSLAHRADTIGRVAPADADLLLGLAARLDDELAGLPRGFAHADFGLPNLLGEGGRLTGVVDWEAAGDGRLPFLDLLHLEVERALDPREELGEAFARHLLPWARAGGDRYARRYAEKLGLAADTATLEHLAAAWWLDVIGYAVEGYDPSTRWRRDWMERNVGAGVSALRAQGMLRP